MKKALNPDDIPRLFAEYWNQRRADWLAALFDADADFINVVGLWWKSRQDIFKAHDYGLRVIFPDSTLKTGRIKVKPLSADTAVVLARMHLSGQTPLNEQAGQRHNIFTFVVKKENGYWLCVSAQNTDIVMGAETYIRSEKDGLKAANYQKK